MPARRNVVCLVVDRLHGGFLGPFGNTWIATPEIDRLAAESFILDRAYIDSPVLESLYRSYWQGRHAMLQSGSVQSSYVLDLPRRLAEAGYDFDVLSDDPVVAHFAGVQALELGGGDRGETTAATVEDTELASFFGVAGDALAELEPPFVFWLHTGSLGRIWDAPLEFRNQYADPDDPPPPESAAVPNQRLPASFDPDELLGIMYAYAGQVALLDTCIGSLLDALAEAPFAQDTLFVFVSARSFPLGEHGRIGPCDEALYGELTQVPWFLRFPDGTGQSDRSQALVQPADLGATLAEWCGLPGPGKRHIAAGRSVLPLAAGTCDAVRDRAVIIGSGSDRAIASPAWYLRTAGVESSADRVDAPAPDNSGDASSELFVKPDDWFEVNDVADRCPQCVAELQEALLQFQQSCESAESIEPPPLSETLMRGLE